MRVLLSLLLCLLLAFSAAAEEAAYTYTDVATATTYDSDTLTYRIDTAQVCGTKCYLIHLWLDDPGRQIKKAISPWHQALAKAETLAAQVEGAALVINGSGYVSPTYPEIPDNYPGTSADYYYTPLGSLTVVDGEVLRNLAGVPYYGLTLETDGLHLYAAADNDEVLSHNPLQTWSFYEGCPLIQDGASIVDRDWEWAGRKATRTIIAGLDSHNYLILIATSSHGLTLLDATDFLLGEFQPDWAYDLDGGPSTALLRRLKGKKTLKLVYGAGQKIVDVMGFIE